MELRLCRRSEAAGDHLRDLGANQGGDDEAQVAASELSDRGRVVRVALAAAARSGPVSATTTAEGILVGVLDDLSQNLVGFAAGAAVSAAAERGEADLALGAIKAEALGGRLTGDGRDGGVAAPSLPPQRGGEVVGEAESHAGHTLIQ